MRLLLSLKCVDSTQRQETDYHYQLQSFIYSLLENSSLYSLLHDKKGYKFFCFSNIFSPVSSNTNIDIRNLTISSPSKDFVRYIGSKLVQKKEQKDQIRIGSLRLVVNDTRILNTELKTPFTLITGTPILMRISKETYQKYNIEAKYPYAYVYWRKEYPLELFTRHLEENLWSKYAEFTNKETAREGEPSLFQKLTFKKQISDSSLKCSFNRTKLM